MAHTCFNQLVLPAYTNKKILKQKLVIAIQNAEGFGIEWESKEEPAAPDIDHAGTVFWDWVFAVWLYPLIKDNIVFP